MNFCEFAQTKYLEVKTPYIFKWLHTKEICRIIFIPVTREHFLFLKIQVFSQYCSIDNFEN